MYLLNRNGWRHSHNSYKTNVFFFYLFWHIKQTQGDTAVHAWHNINLLIIAFWHKTDWNIYRSAQCKIDHWWGKETAFLKSGLFVISCQSNFCFAMFSITLCVCRTPPSSPGRPGSCRLLTRSSLQKQS